MAVLTMIAAVLKFDSCCGSGELLRLRLLGWWGHDSGPWGKVIVLIGNDGSTFDALGCVVWWLVLLVAEKEQTGHN